MAFWLSGPTPLVSTVLSPARSTRCFTLPGRKIRLGVPSSRGHGEHRMTRKNTLAGISAECAPVVFKFAKRVRKFAKIVTNSAAAARKSAGTARKSASAVRNYGETVRELARQATPATRRIAEHQTSATRSRSRTFMGRASLPRCLRPSPIQRTAHPKRVSRSETSARTHAVGNNARRSGSFGERALPPQVPSFHMVAQRPPGAPPDPASMRHPTTSAPAPTARSCSPPGFSPPIAR